MRLNFPPAYRSVCFLIWLVGGSCPAIATPAVTESTEQPHQTTNLRLQTRWINETTLQFRRQDDQGDWETVRVDASDGSMTILDQEKTSSDSAAVGFQGGSVPRSGPANDSIHVVFKNATKQVVQMRWVDGSGRRTDYQRIAPGESSRQHTYAGHVWEAVGQDDTYYGSVVAAESSKPFVIRESFSRPRTANRSRGRRRPPTNVRVVDNVLKVRTGADESFRDIQLPTDGNEDTVQWVGASLSPDASVAAVWKRTPAPAKPVFKIESSPNDGGRAKLDSSPYRLPGDPMDRYELVTVDVEDGSIFDLDVPAVDFGRPRLRWRGDHELMFEKVDRGHQRFRLFAVDPVSGSIRTPIDETTDTFIWTIHGPPVPHVTYLSESDEVIYASEKSGYRHLYLVDLSGEEPMRAITEGDFLVRRLAHLDPQQRYMDLVVGEFYDDQDPYHRHLIRVQIDSGEFVAITDGDGDHEFDFSPNRDFVVVTYSRIDSPPTHELRRASDGQLIATLAESKRLGPAPPLPKRFVAKGRDGETDIWGLICFPDDYDPEASKVYPVIEAIYAGPHDSHVPKRYRHSEWHRAYRDLGFIVVQIDGMGTANRSKAFHDVCWQNLKDAGFPDRIAWMKAAAQEYPAMDLSRVGIYGTSAGGQNACGALLFHGDFYNAAMASCGCHDNRMDKSSWNEQWMGYPVGSHYGRSSNIDNADNLRGDLLLLVGELDSNVPPESTLRLVDALIKANKRFEFLMIPGMGHSDGGSYGRQLTQEFFVRKLQPERKRDDVAATPTLNQAQPLVDLAELEQAPPTLRWQLAWTLYRADRQRLERRFPVRIAADRLVQMQRFLDAWQAVLPKENAEGEHTQGQDNREVIATLRSEIDQQRQRLAEDQIQRTTFLTTFPWIQSLVDLVDVDGRGRPIDFAEAAETVNMISDQVATDLKSKDVQADQTEDEDSEKTERTSDQWNPTAREIFNAYLSWRRFYADYHPEFDWWVGESSAGLQEQLSSWAASVPEELSLDSKELSDFVNQASAREETDQLPESIFFSDYPDLTKLVPGSRMPSVMQRYQRDLRTKRDNRIAVLDAWQSALEEMKLGGKPFDQWSLDDQVDFHRLRQDIKVRHAIANDTTEPKVARSREPDGLTGTIVGRDRLELLLQGEFIDHTPEELIELAEKEYLACRAEMVKTAREMGFGDDWQAAVKKMKQQHVPPGQQPLLIRRTADESVQWLRDHDLLTVDPLADAVWRMIMMTPERQRVNPFFTGGEIISVSFPTRQMSLSDKLQSLRGNNPAFARATVHHELIPGHHYQGYQNSRFQTHRRSFRTPFWLEGWAVYWEFVLYDGGFPMTPENRLGFLVWRAHRYARIMFSLRFHLGKLSPDECVSFLVDNVGFNYRNSKAEVRRSIGPSYPPLYQAAYMLGAMQFRQLAQRWIDENRGTIKEFHDQVLRLGQMPIALLQSRLFDEPMDRDQPPMWKFKVD